MNLNIEGTKHEKAVLVILSYVAGFTAGFIVFGLSQTPALQSVTVTPEVVTAVPNNVVAEVPAPAAPAAEAVENTETPDMSQEVLYKDGRLMANVNGASVLLSAQLQTVDAETAKAFANQGVHETIPQYMASDDGNFIYYCEQHSQADSCTNFVYDVTNQIIQYVTRDGAKLVTTAEEAKTATWSGSTLTIGSASSASAATPWKLVSAQ
jgi:hypothetical protein